MAQPKAALAPKPRAVTIHGHTYNLVAFYFPDYDTPWDLEFQAQFLGNFYQCTLTLTVTDPTGKTSSATFHNAEAAFQATKCWYTPERKKFEDDQTGTEAFHDKLKIANPDDTYANFGDHDKAMKAVLRAKYTDPALRKALLLTGDAYLLEHNEKKGRDKYWSDDHDGLKKGDPLGKTLNMLGKTLMEVREECGGPGAPAGNYAVADFTAQV